MIAVLDLLGINDNRVIQHKADVQGLFDVDGIDGHVFRKEIVFIQQGNFFRFGGLGVFRPTGKFIPFGSVGSLRKLCHSFADLYVFCKGFLAIREGNGAFDGIHLGIGIRRNSHCKLKAADWKGCTEGIAFFKRHELVLQD